MHDICLYRYHNWGVGSKVAPMCPVIPHMHVQTTVAIECTPIWMIWRNTEGSQLQGYSLCTSSFMHTGANACGQGVGGSRVTRSNPSLWCSCTDASYVSKFIVQMIKLIFTVGSHCGVTSVCHSTCWAFLLHICKKPKEAGKKVICAFVSGMFRALCATANLGLLLFICIYTDSHMSLYCSLNQPWHSLKMCWILFSDKPIHLFTQTIQHI